MKTDVLLANSHLVLFHVWAVRQAPPPEMDKDDDEWTAIDEALFSPKMLKSGIIVILDRACSHNKSMHNLELFVNALVYERKKIILNETGMFVSSSLFIPYDIMPATILKILDDLIECNLPRSVFKKDATLHICFELPTEHPNASNNALGVVNVVCGLLLAINEAGESKIIKKKSNHKLCIFDVILKSVFFKHRVEYSMVMRKCVHYGYCGPREINESTESKVTDANVVPLISASLKGKKCVAV